MKDQTPNAAKPVLRAQSQTNEARAERIDVKSLLQGGDQIELLHNGEIYRLRVTSKGRLILTK
ncbi:MAG: hemin uptake protein HemP [Pseudomonadota bacterium]